MADVVVGVIGGGFAARLHLKAWRRVAGVGVDVRGVACAHPERSRDLAEEYALSVPYADAQAVWTDPAIDVVDLCVPNYLHEQMVLAALAAAKHVIVEKPLTGVFSDPASTTPSDMLRDATSRAEAMVAAARDADRLLCYAENWIYAPPIQKARSLLAAAGGTILRIQGEESHSGTHSPSNKRWVTAGGGSLLGKGCHPLGAALYLKAAEGRDRTGTPIVPVSVTAETAQLTRVASFTAEEPIWLGTGYEDVEDWASMLVRFSDNTVAEITAADTTLGGIRNRLTVFASNAVVEANLNPNTAVRAYAPSAEVFAQEYLSEKLETKAGWSYPAPDEDWMQGYPQELEDFALAVATGRQPQSDGALARAVVTVVYAAYLSAAEGRRVSLEGVL